MKRLLIAGVALMLAGCGSAPGAGESFQAKLHCKTGRDCQIKMGKAYDYINKIGEISRSSGSTIKSKDCGPLDGCLSYFVHKRAETEYSDVIDIEVSCKLSYCDVHPRKGCEDLYNAMK